MAQSNIIEETKYHRLRWLDHVEHMKEDPFERKPVWCPKYRWKDMMAKDLFELREYINLQNKMQWRQLLWGAKTHFGSLSQRNKLCIHTYNEQNPMQ